MIIDEFYFAMTAGDRMSIETDEFIAGRAAP
jgi:hypothetical protein